MSHAIKDEQIHNIWQVKDEPFPAWMHQHFAYWVEDGVKLQVHLSNGLNYVYPGTWLIERTTDDGDVYLEACTVEELKSLFKIDANEPINIEATLSLLDYQKGYEEEYVHETINLLRQALYELAQERSKT